MRTKRRAMLGGRVSVRTPASSRVSTTVLTTAMAGVLAIAVAACSGAAVSPSDATNTAQHEGGGLGAPGTNATVRTTAPRTPPVTSSALATARRDVAALDTRRLAAQIVVPDLGTVDAGVAGIRDQGYGGVMVMRSALTTGSGAATSAAAANRRYAQAVTGSGRAWPAFIGIDQEGGPVTRLEGTLTPFPAAMALGATGDPALATRVGRASGAELRGLGFTVVMAPDADVTIGADDPTIGIRSPGTDPQLVSRIALGYVAGYRQAGIVPVVKHFPGHGAVAADTHAGTAQLTASRATLETRELVPFRDAVAAGAPAIMTAHVVATAVDRSRPASLSAPVTTGMLRRDLGFTGLVVTDALNMGAVTAATAPGEAAVRAVEAGADVLLMPSDPGASVVALEKAVTQGRITRARLEESAARMVATLRSAGSPVTGRAAQPGANADVARQVAAASVTQVAGRCGGRLVGQAVTVVGGDAADRARFEAAAKARGLRVGGSELRGATRVVLLSGQSYRADGRPRSGSGAVATRAGDVVVALDVPYGLAAGSASAKLAVFGRTPATFTAVLDVLTGRASAAGRLPVPVGSWPVGAGCGRG